MSLVFIFMYIASYNWVDLSENPQHPRLGQTWFVYSKIKRNIKNDKTNTAYGIIIIIIQRPEKKGKDIE